MLCKVTSLVDYGQLQEMQKMKMVNTKILRPTLKYYWPLVLYSSRYHTTSGHSGSSQVVSSFMLLDRQRQAENGGLPKAAPQTQAPNNSAAASLTPISDL